MQRYGFLAFCLVALGIFASPLQAQSRSPLIPDTTLRRFGLQRSWFAQVQVNAAVGRVTHTRLHVSSSESLTVYEVTQGERQEVFSERNLNAYGEPVGRDGAKQLAEARAAVLSANGNQATVEEKVIPEITLYVVTDQALLHAINAENGHTRWALPVGEPYQPSVEPGVDDRYVAVLTGLTLFVIDAKEGRILWEKGVEGVPGAGPVISDRYVYVPLLTGVMQAFQLDDPTRWPQLYKSHGQILVRPTSTIDGVVWATTRGHLNVARSGANGVRYRLESKDSITNPVSFAPPDRLFATTEAGFVYAFQEGNGRMTWKFSCGEVTSAPPVVIGDSVYVVTYSSGMFALDLATGQQKWFTPRVRSFVAASSNRLYCTDDTGRLMILDRPTGGRLATLPTEGLDLKIMNVQTDRIYIGNRTGLVQCFREIQQRWPVIHMDDLEITAPAAVDVQPGPAQPEPAVPTGPRNPFGEPATPAINPFDTTPKTDGGNPFK